MALTLRQGDIIWAFLADDRGSVKFRPAVVLATDAALQSGDPFAVAAVTTTFPDPPPAGHVELPWNADPRRTATGLSRRSAAVTGWVRQVDSAEVDHRSGRVPARLMIVILQRVAPA